MRWSIVWVALVAGCATQPNHLGNPLLLPISGFTTAVGNANYAQRRAKVEVFVKSNHPALISQIMAGGGTTLTEAMDLSGIPLADRPARLIQMRADLGLYDRSPDALVTALMVYGA